MNRFFNSKVAAALSVVAVAALSRFLPHPPNFTAILGAAIFSGAIMKDKYLAALLPVAAMIVSDLFLGLHESLFAVYASVIACSLIGRRFASNRAAVNVFGVSLASAVLFFVVTNLSVWALSGMYPMNFGGLVSSYIMAVPFFGNLVAGTLLSSFALFTGYSLLEKYAARKVALN
ncbi:MAG: DUF6580 family putative transport protein [Chloroflexota bacterium]